MKDGRRQIVSLLIPGDSFHLTRNRYAWENLPIVALTSVTLADATLVARASRMRTPAHANLIDACERAAVADFDQLINQIGRLGPRTAYERVAHLLVELNARLTSVGLSNGAEFELPIRQPDLAAAVGLSAVHLNRVLRDLRIDKLIRLRGRSLAILDLQRLMRIADVNIDNRAER